MIKIIYFYCYVKKLKLTVSTVNLKEKYLICKSEQKGSMMLLNRKGMD